MSSSVAAMAPTLSRLTRSRPRFEPRLQSYMHMHVPPATRAPDAPMNARSWLLLVVLSGAVFLEGADISMMGVALPSIRAELGMSTASLQWVVSAYVLGYGGFVLLGGRVGDLVGRRRLFLAALTVFLAFSGLGGTAQEGW